MGEDYDSAKSIKAEIDRLKDSAMKGPGGEPLSFPSLTGPGSNRGGQ